MKRKAIPKKIRFEVFKRDKFSCQYCGQKAPDVILHVDHLDPVSKGGTNEILNLVTSCVDCNSGKSNVLLSDETVLAKQRAQVELCQDRLEQLKMMMEWKKSLRDLDDAAVAYVLEHFEVRTPGWSINENGKKALANLLTKYAFENVLTAVDLSCQRYLKIDEVGIATKDSVTTALDRIGGILFVQALPDDEQELYRVRKAFQRKMLLKNYYYDHAQCLKLLRRARDCGATPQHLMKVVELSRNWTVLVQEIEHIELVYSENPEGVRWLFDEPRSPPEYVEL